LLHQLSGNTTLSNKQKQLISTLYVNIYQKQGRVLAALSQYDRSLIHTDSSASYQQILLDTWSYLQTQSTLRLTRALAATDPTSNAAGWIRLAQIAKAPLDNVSLATALSQWRQQFPNHPANRLLPSRFPQQFKPPEQVTLLVPLSGSLKSAGQAIRNGFFAAYYEAKKSLPNVPSVRVIDANSAHISQLALEAQQSGSDFIVGPLTKEKVTQLSENMPENLRVLALNSTGGAHVENLYQFGLDPTAELPQVVERAWKKQHSHALVIVPKGAWGERLLQSFQDLWQAQGGQVVDVLRFHSVKDLGPQIRHLLRVDDSAQRYRHARQLSGKKLRYTPRRRQDADMIFIAAQPAAARQIRPLLKFYYAANLPTYAISSIYSGQPHTRLDRDLNGIRFCDMPWVIAPEKTLTPELRALQNRIKQLWPNSYAQHSKLYALGVDAFHLVHQLGRLMMLPNFGIAGATGRLYLDEQQHITRQLIWARMQNAQPEQLPKLN
jgi:outer membrane PBP1 activator LpoA protein